MASLKDGDSEIATAKLILLDSDKEIKNWKNFSITSSFTQPCDKFSFQISAKDIDLYQDYLIPDARVQITVDNAIQCTGMIDDNDISYSPSSGTDINLSGRDVLAPMVDYCVDPTFKFNSKMTVADVVTKVMTGYGFTKLFNSQDNNLNIITGRTNDKSLTTKVTTQTDTSYGAKGADGKLVKTVNEVKIYETVSNIKPGLSKLQIKQYKANVGETAYNYVQRLIKREGLTLKAAADGSGLMVISPDYDFDFGYSISVKKDAVNNGHIINSNRKVSASAQPTVIVASGFGTGSEYEKAQLKVIIVNELTGLDENGNYLPEVENIIGKYKSAKVLPIRTELIPVKRTLAKVNRYRPIFMTFSEAKDIAQLSALITRKLSEGQMKGLTVKYTVKGFVDPSNGYPWAVNTLVNVDDDINDIHEQLWVLERTFTKSVSSGTITSLTLIRPNTLLLGE